MAQNKNNNKNGGDCCSFCGAKRTDVEIMFQGSDGANICNKCIENGYKIIVDNDIDAADATFTATITPADYDLTSEEWAEKSPEYFYDRETLDNTAFAEVVDNLTEQVNAYLAEVDDED